MYYETKISNAKAYVYETKGKVVLSSSSKVAPLSTLKYDYAPSGYKEVARVNASIFEMSSCKHLGWEYSDVFKTKQASDTTADCLIYKDGSVQMGDIDYRNVNLDNLESAYTGSHVILQDGKDVCICASWREKYTTGKYCWSWFATKSDGTYVVGALNESDTCNADELRSYLKSIGCVNAIVNDGGGSAELIVNGKVVNRKSERSIANGLFVYEPMSTSTSSNSELTRLRAENAKLKSVLSQIKNLVKDY